MALLSSTPPPTTLRAAERALRVTAESIVADIDELAHTVTLMMLREVSEASTDPLSLEETRRTTRATLLGLFDGWRRGEPLERLPPPPELLFQLGITARDGIPLAPVLRMCHLAHGAFADIWDERIGAAGLPAEVQAVTIRMGHQLTFAWFDGLVAQLAAAHEEERQRMARTPETVRREAVHAALSGKPVDLDALSRLAGYEFRRRHIGLVLWRGTPVSDGVPAVLDTQPVFAAIAREIATKLGAAPPLVVASASSVAWAWVAVREAPPTQQVYAVVNGARHEGVSLAIGEPAGGLEGFRTTHDDAVVASRIAMLQVESASGGTVLFDDVELAALISDDVERTRRFVRRQLGPLAGDDAESARLRTTLRVFLEERGARTAAAKRLGVHPNTVTNRAQACRDLIGRDLSERPVELQVALVLAETLGARVIGS